MIDVTKVWVDFGSVISIIRVEIYGLIFGVGHWSDSEKVDCDGGVGGKILDEIETKSEVSAEGNLPEALEGWTTPNVSFRIIAFWCSLRGTSSSF